MTIMAYAHDPIFFDKLWRGLKPLCQIRPFVEAFMDLRDDVESRTAELSPAYLVEPLASMGYAPQEIDAIRQINEIFSHGNQLSQTVFEDIKTTLQLPFVNTDYRAFARWPSYFALAWDDRRDKVGTSLYEATTLACHDRAAKLAAEELPNPGGLSSKALRQAAKADASLDEMIQVCRLFQWLIPGLITNVAYFRHQLQAVRWDAPIMRPPK